MAGKYGYLAKNTLIFTISSFGSKLLAFLLIPLYTSVLSTEEYGTADLITTASNLLVFAATLCIADAVLRFAMDGADRRKGVFGFGLRVVLAGCGIAGLILAALALINPFHWENYIYLFLFLTLFSNAMNQLAAGYLQAIDRIPAVAVMGILVTLVTIVSNLLLLLVFRAGVIGYLLSFVIGYTLSAVYGFLVIAKHDKGSFAEICDPGTRRRMIAYSLPLILNGAAWWLNNSLDRFFIIGFCGVAVNGLYAAASKIPTILAAGTQIFSQAWNLSAIREFNREDRGGFFSNIYGSYNFVLTAGCSALILLNIPLARILFAKDFFVAWEYVSLLVITAVFSALSGFFGSIFSAVKNSRVFAVSTLMAAILNAVLNWILIPRYGALGGAASTAVSFFAVWMIRYIYASRYIRMKVRLARDLAAYALLVIQVVFEHTEGHGYLWQGVIFLAILALYSGEMIGFYRRIRQARG